MTDTPKDIHLAIWELLTPEERHLARIQWLGSRRYWYCFPKVSDSNGSVVFSGGHTIPDFIAHRAIADAAREVLDNKQLMIRRIETGKWWFEKSCATLFDTRTEAIYHALKWLRGQKR